MLGDAALRNSLTAADSLLYLLPFYLTFHCYTTLVYIFLSFLVIPLFRLDGDIRARLHPICLYN